MNLGFILACFGTILFIILIIIIYKRVSKRKKFNMHPRTHRENIDDVYEDDEDVQAEQANENENKRNLLDVGIVRSGDEIFDSWSPFEYLLKKEAHLVRVINDMIEIDIGDGTRTFVGIAEMAQSNPYLATPQEQSIDIGLQQVFLHNLNSKTKISSQWQRTDMSGYFNAARKRINKDECETGRLKKLGMQVIADAENEEKNFNRFENHTYVQFTTSISDKDVYGDTVKDIETNIIRTADHNIETKILQANQSLRLRNHELTRLSNFEILDLMYKTFNRDGAKLIPLEKIVREQKYSLFTTAGLNDQEINQLQQMLQVEDQTRVAVKNSRYMQELSQQLKTAYNAYQQEREHIRSQIKHDLQEREEKRLKEEIKRSKHLEQ